MADLTLTGGTAISGDSDDRLTSVANVKAYMQIASTAFDTLLAQLLDEVEDELKQYMRIGMIYTIYDSDNAGALVLDGNDAADLLLPHYPFWTVTSVRYAESDGSFPATNEVDAEIYRLDPESGILSRQGAGDSWSRGVTDGGRWTPGFRNWQIEGTAGWKGPNQSGVPATVDSVPKSIQAGIHEVVADRFSRSQQLRSGQVQNELAAEGIPGQQTASYRKELDEWTGFPITAKRKFDKFRTRM